MNRRIYQMFLLWQLHENGALCKPQNKQNCTEPERERMRDDLMELNDKELNYIYFDKDSDDASNKSDEDIVL